MVASKYNESYNELAKSVARVCGATDKQLAEIIGISEATLYEWKIRHPEFAVAVKEGKDEFDTERVENALLQRSLGYSHDDVHISTFQGEVIVTPVTKHYPPDTTAAQFWLKNRDRSRWKDKQDVEINGNIGINVTEDESEL